MAPRYGCERLCSVADVGWVGDCDVTTVPTADVEAAIDSATDVLIGLTGRTLGRCEVTLRPCRQACAGHPCGCCVTRGILLEGVAPTVSEVMIDGAVVDPGTYTVVTSPSGDKYLERFHSDGRPDYWPNCQKVYLPTTEQDTFSVTYEHGEAIDMLMRWATAEIALDTLGPLIHSKERTLDSSVTRLNAYSMEMSMQQEVVGSEATNIDRLSGLGWVKRFLAAYPPIEQSAFVWAPELASSGWRHFQSG
jgi:hypothetical protein